MYGYSSPQIGDLGLAVSISEASVIKDIKGVMPFLAPELLSGRGSYSQKTDVYAFGIIMWEISSRQPPFHNIAHDTQLALRILKGLRPEITNDTPLCYRDLLQQCWHSDPTQRPTAAKIHETINSWYTNGQFKNEIKNQLKKAEDVRQQNIDIKKETKSHPGAIYTSRFLTNITNGKNRHYRIFYIKLIFSINLFFLSSRISFD